MNQNSNIFKLRDIYRIKPTRPTYRVVKMRGAKWEIRKWVGERESGAHIELAQMVGPLFSDSKKESNSIKSPFFYS